MIIRGGKDFYDSAMAFGQEDGAVFRRKGYPLSMGFPDIPNDTPSFTPNELDETSPKIDFANLDGPGRSEMKFRVKEGSVTVTPVVVWFCGKRYGGLRWWFCNHGWGMTPEIDLEGVYWSYEAVLAALEAAKPLPDDHPRRPEKKHSTGRKALERFFNYKGNPLASEFLIANKIAIAVRDSCLHGANWIINADVLKAVEFQKVLNPWQAMQELNIYVDGVIPQAAAPMIEIKDDAVKIAKHGFNEKSFRKEPTKKR